MKKSQKTATILIKNAHILTMNQEFDTFIGDMLVQAGKIHQFGKCGAFIHLENDLQIEVIDAKDCLLLPGFVQSHVHLCQTLFRGFAEDLPLMDWLSKYIWPFESAHITESLRASTKLGLAELIRGGTTAALDMGTVQHTDVIFEEALAAGFRLVSGKAMMDKGETRPGNLFETTQQSLDASLLLAEKWHQAGDGLLRYAFAPRFILSCSDEVMLESSRLAQKMGALLHTHSSENPGEIALVKQITGKENILALNDLECLGPHVVLAHCVWLNESEKSLLQSSQTKIAHCPSTNLKLASGIASIPELLRMGIKIGLGADGAPCNNRLDMFREMSNASLLQKYRLNNACAMPAKDVLRMATMGGAEVLGLEQEIGSLEIGKQADFMIVSRDEAHFYPLGDPYTALVHQASKDDVRDVFVAGKALLRNRRLCTIARNELLSSIPQTFESLLERSGHTEILKQLQAQHTEYWEKDGK